YDALFDALAAEDEAPDSLVHMWSLTRPGAVPLDLDSSRTSQDLGFYSLLFIAQAIAKRQMGGSLRWFVISNNVQNVRGDEDIIPAKATILGPIKVIPKELRNASCRSIDVELPNDDRLSERFLVDPLI